MNYLYEKVLSTAGGFFVQEAKQIWWMHEAKDTPPKKSEMYTFLKKLNNCLYNSPVLIEIAITQLECIL